VLLLWVVLLLAVVVGQHLTAHSIERGGYWTPSGPAPPTTEELVWYRLPPALLVTISILLFVGSKWVIPEKGTRSIVRVWGFFATFVTYLYSSIIAGWFRIMSHISYMD